MIEKLGNIVEAHTGINAHHYLEEDMEESGTPRKGMERSWKSNIRSKFV